MKKILAYYYIILFVCTLFYGYNLVLSSSRELNEKIDGFRLQIPFEFATASESVNDIVADQSFQKYIDTRNTLAKSEFEKSLMAMMENQPNYDQIRYIDLKGDELIRVDLNHETNKPFLVKSNR